MEEPAIHEFRRKMKLESSDFSNMSPFHKGVKNKNSKLIFWLVPGGVAVLTLVFCLTAFKEPKPQPFPAFVAFMTVALFLATEIIILFFMLLRKMMRPLFLKAQENRQRKMYEQSSNEYEIVVNDIGVSANAEKFKQFVLWRDVLNVVEDEKAFYIYYSQESAIIILKRHVESLDEMLFLKNLFASKVSVKT